MRNLSGGHLPHTSPARRFPYHVLILVLLTLLAFFLRTHQLATTPPAFDYDEAAHAIDALELLQGHHSLFSPKIEGIPTFFMYLIAGFFKLLGVRTFTARLFVAFISTMTVALMYPLVRSMFRELGERRSQVIGILATLGLATSFWHVIYSRIGFEYNTVPLFEALCFYFLWTGLKAQRVWRFVLSGFWLGLAAYAYHTPRFLPILLILFFIHRYWTSSSRERSVPGRQPLLAAFRPLFIIGLAALIVFIPLGTYFALHPEAFLGRAQGTLFLNPRVSQGDPWGTLWQGFVGTVGAFGFTSDMHSQANLPGKSILNPALAVLFWAGLALSLIRFKKAPYAFCVLWWGVMIFPVIITPDRVPHYGRMLSLAPVTYILIAVTLERLYAFVSDRVHWRAARAVFVAACAVLFSATALSTYHDYFFKWASAENTYLAFSGPAQELAEIVNRDTDQGRVYVVPCDAEGESQVDYSYECNHFPLSFFHHLEGAVTPLEYVFMHEPGVPERLSQVTNGKDHVSLIALKKGKRKFLYPEADPRNLLHFFLDGTGHLEGVESSPYYDIYDYRLATDQTEFMLPNEHDTFELEFEGQLLLKEGGFGGVSDGEFTTSRDNLPGGEVWAILKWDVLGPVHENYRSTLRLVDQAGHVVVQVDHVLFGPRRMGTSRWTEAATPVSDFYLLSVPSTTPPGTYDLQVGLYPPGAERLLSVGDTYGETLASLGTLRIDPPEEAPALVEESVDVVHQLDSPLTSEIGVLGHDLDLSRIYVPGEQATLLSYWQVSGSPKQDLLWNLELWGEGERWSLIEPAPPLGPEFPTSSWSHDQVWQGLYDFVIPPQVPGGSHDLVGFFTTEGGLPHGEAVWLGSMEVSGKARSFEVPDITRPLDASFDGKMRLLGFDGDAEDVERGASYELVLHWQALTPMDTSYTTFVHVRDAGAQVRAQRDTVPGDGTLPTTGWLPGEVISDRIVIPLDGDLLPGTYTVAVGVYDSGSGQRLQATGADEEPLGDHLILQSVEVTP